MRSSGEEDGVEPTVPRRVVAVDRFCGEGGDIWIGAAARAAGVVERESAPPTEGDVETNDRGALPAVVAFALDEFECSIDMGADMS